MDRDLSRSAQIGQKSASAKTRGTRKSGTQSSVSRRAFVARPSLVQYVCCPLYRLDKRCRFISSFSTHPPNRIRFANLRHSKHYADGNRDHLSFRTPDCTPSKRRQDFDVIFDASRIQFQSHEFGRVFSHFRSFSSNSTDSSQQSQRLYQRQI